ncbi:glycosyltransferase [Gemmobacter lutimaris]|uniref:Glycosyltransferase n=1 Tax=Gemmobacter lutimaris TaxID=2306023 RepID=A0A398BPT8_9RHOB|nr:glycosyltransferase [Gemmobacter lutimaris]RID92565.1 glycosyltransferase [Gemmobacter lutimaris]
MQVDLGVFAHNEAAGIATMVARLTAQTVPGLDLRILVLANGCTDDTAALARAAGAEVADLPEGGKSRTWNRFVHDLSRPEARVLIFADADIQLPDADALARLVAALQARPELHVMNSRPVKDIVADPRGLGWQDRLIAMAGGTLDDWQTAICGQLYAMPATCARLRWLPAGLPVEDGFLRAMVLTDDLTVSEDLPRIGGADVWHIYESERSIAGLIRHQVRIVIGSALNMAAFDALREMAPPVRKATLQLAARDQGWLRRIAQARLPRWPDGFVPLHFLVKRSRNLLCNPRRLLRPKGLLLLVAGFGFDLIVWLIAQIRMARGTGAGHW